METLILYATCPMKDCKAIVIPAVEQVAERKRFDIVSGNWSLRCPRCSLQFAVDESDFKVDNISIEQIRRDYPNFQG